MRIPPASVNAARSISMKAEKPCVRIARGENVVRPHDCPAWLNRSGGAPTDTPCSISSRYDQAWLPALSHPTARSAIRPIAMPESRATCCACDKPLAASHCAKRKKSTSFLCAVANSATAALRGSRSSPAQLRQWPSLASINCAACSASKRAWSSSARPPRLTKRAKSLCNMSLSCASNCANNAQHGQLRRHHARPVDQLQRFEFGEFICDTGCFYCRLRRFHAQHRRRINVRDVEEQAR